MHRPLFPRAHHFFSQEPAGDALVEGQCHCAAAVARSQRAAGRLGAVAHLLVDDRVAAFDVEQIL
jgi:hypothetical protein